MQDALFFNNGFCHVSQLRLLILTDETSESEHHYNHKYAGDMNDQKLLIMT